MIELPICRWRVEACLPDHVSCKSPKIVGSKDYLDPSWCLICPYANHEPIATRAGNPPLTVGKDPAPFRTLPLCVHKGSSCPPPTGRDFRREWFQCERGHGVVCACSDCPYCPEHAIICPKTTLRLNSKDLAQGSKDNPFNCSLIDFRQGSTRFLLTYRLSRWVYLARLDDNLNVIEANPLNLSHPFSNRGAEDARFFWRGSKLCLSFTGLSKVGHHVQGSVLWAELDPALQVSAVHYPEFEKRTPCEKNWSFFEGPELLAVYSIHPFHMVLSIGESATLVHQTRTPDVWTGGLLRGGASPVKVGHEWYHFFHGWKRVGKSVIYSVGVYTFADQPPYNVLRMSRSPIQSADLSTDPGSWTVHKKSIIFPCGAFCDGSDWWISYGHHDAFCEVSRFSVASIEDVLETVPPA